ncbi:RNase adapter RapZ [Sphingomicrobium astaxanthinifaciens]|uniref:RNase adapter RapZ n=1 Tax=Sphingomicrobium astaxanthinifaciens TaxID=1227949 RepID=UPI001FCB866D|nr:RNase adapter RapZ [Sphingomicrobium astaxanthinifaciens]MCJ7422198.1 RNase adapter RapZ [Sphingomicrobium astaxanthinifaciens]
MTPAPAPRRRRRLLVVTGMSGAGKSTALDTLEDWGWDIVDNLPVAMLEPYVAQDVGADPPPMAVGIDMRSRGFSTDALLETLDGLEGIEAELLFLDCDSTELARRYDETRRRHPLADDRPAEDGIWLERRLLAALRERADAVIETTATKPVELREDLRSRFRDGAERPVITVASFGFARGVARTADLTFDMRFLDNPHWVPELKPLTGRDEAVKTHVSADPAYGQTMDRIETLVVDLIPRYWEAGKHYLTIAFGCTGGRHRSVAAAEDMAIRLRSRGHDVSIRHRDLAAQPDDRFEKRKKDRAVS